MRIFGCSLGDSFVCLLVNEYKTNELRFTSWMVSRFVHRHSRSMARTFKFGKRTFCYYLSEVFKFALTMCLIFYVFSFLPSANSSITMVNKQRKKRHDCLTSYLPCLTAISQMLNNEHLSKRLFIFYI